MAQNNANEVSTVGCDKCGYYVEFESFEQADIFFESGRQGNPFNCEHKLGIVNRHKDLDFR